MSNTKKLSKSAVQELARLLLDSVEEEATEDFPDVVEGCDCDCDHSCSPSSINEHVLYEFFQNHSEAFSSVERFQASLKSLENLCEEVDSATTSLENALVSELAYHVDSLKNLSESLSENLEELSSAVEDSLELFDEGHLLLEKLRDPDDTE
jgi:hypothetical protein